VRHHPLREQRVEGLGGRSGRCPVRIIAAGEEARVEQVQDRVLDAADVLVHVHPVGGLVTVGRRSAWGAVKRA
jgi:hypothetical protein